MGETATERSRRRASASRTPGTASTGPIDTIGFDGATTSVSASAMRLEDAGRGRRRFVAGEAHGGHRHVVVAVHEVLLEVDLLAVPRA